MKAGRELDALLAEKIFGCKVDREKRFYEVTMFCGCPGRQHDSDSDRVEGIPWYSTDIAAAWQVVDHVRYSVRNGRFVVRAPEGPAPAYWSAGYEDTSSEPGYGDSIHHWLVEGETAPHAICLAALRVIGVRDQQ